MTKLIKTLLLTASLSSSLFSDTVFDLGAQQFYYCVTDVTNDDGTTSDQYVNASYDVETAIVSTGLISEDGYYRPASSRSGHFGVQLKEPKSKWGITFSMYAYLHNDGCSIQLLGESGQAVMVHFDYVAISYEGKEIEINDFTYGENISGTIMMNGDNIDIIINGHTKFSIKKPNFKLAKVNLSLYTDTSSSIGRIDKLHSLTISTSD